jgi:hypothetical protein
MFHWPADGQFQLLKGDEEDQVVTEVIRAASVTVQKVGHGSDVFDMGMLEIIHKVENK